MKKTLSIVLSILMIVTTLFAVPFSASAAINFASAKQIVLNKNYYTKIVNSSDYGIYSFTPSESGWYSFASDEEDNCDAYCELYDQNGLYVDYDDDDVDVEFNLEHNLVAGVTYFYIVHAYGFDETNTGINAKLTKIASREIGIKSVSFSNYDEICSGATVRELNDGNLVIDNGFDENAFYSSIITVTFSNDTVKQYAFNGSNFVNVLDSGDGLSLYYSTPYQLAEAGVIEKTTNGIIIFNDYNYILNVNLASESTVASFQYIPENPSFAVKQTPFASWMDVITEARIIVNYRDGSTATFLNYDTGGFYGNQFYNQANPSEWKNIFVSHSIDASNVGTSTVQIGFIDCISSFTFNVVADLNAVASVAYAPDAPVVLAESNYYDCDDWFWYINGKFTVTLYNGTTTVYSGNPSAGFYDSESNPLPLSIGHSDSDPNNWRLGSDNYYNILIGSGKIPVQVTIVDKPTVSFVPDSPIVITDGYFDCDNWFWYVSGTITITDAFGVARTYHGYAEDGFVDSNGNPLPEDIDHNDNDTINWKIGSDNYYNYEIGGSSCKVQVTVDHDYCNYPKNDPTCTTDGFEAYTGCTYCDYGMENYVVLPATGHIDEDNDSNCDVCGNHFAFNVKSIHSVDAKCGDTVTFSTGASVDNVTYQWYKGPSPIEGATSSTLTLTNVLEPQWDGAEISCEITDQYSNTEYTNYAYIYINHNHVLSNIMKQPTCSREGEATYTCACGDSYNDYLPELGHNYVNGVDAVAPTCTALGYTGDLACTKCGRVKEAGVDIPMLAHSFGDNLPACAVCGVANPNYVAPAPAPVNPTPAPVNPTPSPINPAPAPQPSTQDKVNSVASQYGVSKATLALNDKAVTSAKGDSDLKGSDFGKLQLKQAKADKTSIKVSWSKVAGADGYIVYANTCGSKLKKVKDTTSTSYTQKKLKKGKYYKFVVVAYKNVDGQKVTLAASKTIHATTAGGKYGNPKAVKLGNVKKNKLTIKKGKTFTVKASQVKADKTIKKHTAIKFETSNAKVATVDSKGKISAKKKGTCKIYVYAQNGVSQTITVTVK